MIYGPITPRTADALSDVADRHLGDVEGGLRCCASGLRVGSGALVDRLAVDAAGVPVFVFLAQPGDDRPVPGNVGEALAWFDASGAALAGLLQEVGARVDGRVRALVLGFDLSESSLRRLRELDDRRITVLRLEPFEIGGERRLGIVPVLDGEPAAPAALPAGLSPQDERDAYDGREQVARLVDLLGRLDPELTAVGDRYTRYFSGSRGPLLELRRNGRTVEARPVGSDGFRELRGDADVADVFDRAARHFLLVGDPASAQPRAHVAGRSAGLDGAAARTATEPARRAGAAGPREFVGARQRPAGDLEVSLDELVEAPTRRAASARS
ncbi:MAG: hypothetical protein IPM29_01380 [Planctomycetes bacterium]|nr:hypothetical protein [Planctomycetota bacterium]